MTKGLRLLITGSSGFIGGNLAAHFLQRGCEICATDFVPPERREHQKWFRQCDVLDAIAFRKLVSEFAPDFVVHLGARTDFTGRSLEDYAANTTGVENVVAAVAATPSVQRVLFASSRMVCRIDHIPKTYDEYSPPNYYGESKVIGERVVRESNLTCSWTIFRPTSIWGPGFQIPYRTFFDQIRRGWYFHQGNYSPRKSFGYVGNSVFQIERLLLAPENKVARRCFYLGDYQPLVVRDWAEMIRREFGYERPIKTLPLALLRPAAWAGDTLNFLIGKDVAPLTSFRLANLTCDMIYPQLQELAEVIGPLPYTLEKGTRETVRWLFEDERRQTLR